jgi:hypothetical protein
MKLVIINEKLIQLYKKLLTVKKKTGNGIKKKC